MDKIRKIAKWAWINKERMVLIIMVGVLVHRVYKVIYPDIRKDIVQPEAPRKIWDDVPPDILKKIKPPLPSIPPTIDIKENYRNFINRNPFWLYAKGSSTSKAGEITAADLGIVLHMIRKSTQGKLKAQISTPTVGKRWRYQGAEFEQFELVDINEYDNSITIFANQHRKEFTYTMP